MVTETWLTPADPGALVEVTPPDFKHFHLPQAGEVV